MENEPAKVVDDGLVVTDADHATLAGAVVRISDGFAPGQDVLSFVDTGTITSRFDPMSGELTLGGLDTIANYQAALRSVTYQNTSDHPSTLPRTITFLVTDGQASSAPATRDLRVRSINDPPAISAIANQEISEDGRTEAIEFQVSDADTPAESLTLSWISEARALVPESSVVVSGTGVDRTVTVTPAADQNGRATITLTVADAEGLTASTSFVLTVNPVNDPPTISAIANQRVDEDGTTAAIAFLVSDLESPAETLRVSAASNHPALVPADNVRLDGSGEIRTATVIPVRDQNGAVSITLSVVDEDGWISSATFAVVVGAVNDAPVARDDTYNLDEDVALSAASVLANDDDRHGGAPNENHLPLTAVGVSGPAHGRLAFAADGTFTYEPEPDFNGDDHFTYVAIDNLGAVSAPATVQLKVGAANDGPALAFIGNKEACLGEPLTFIVTAADVEAPPETLRFSLDPDAEARGARIDPLSGEFIWTPSGADALGTHAFTITVTDDGVPPRSRSETIQVGVKEAAECCPLSLTRGGDQSADEGETLRFLPAVLDACPAKHALRFSLAAGAPTGAEVDPVTGEFRWTPTEAQGPGIYRVTLLVMDDRELPLGAGDTLRITVNEANQAPVLPSIADRLVKLGDTLAFDIAATDADLPAQGLAYALESSDPLGATIEAATGRFSWIPGEAQRDGTFEFDMRVTDGGTPPLSAADPRCAQHANGERRRPGQFRRRGERLAAPALSVVVQRRRTDRERQRPRPAQRTVGIGESGHPAERPIHRGRQQRRWLDGGDSHLDGARAGTANRARAAGSTGGDQGLDSEVSSRGVRH